MSFSLITLLIFTYRLDFVLASRTDLAAVPFSAARPLQPSGLPPPNSSFAASKRRTSFIGRLIGIVSGVKSTWDTLINWVTDRLELWVAPKDDKQIAWTLGIGWACCGGGLAGGCLVFAKATYVLSLLVFVIFETECPSKQCQASIGLPLTRKSRKPIRTRSTNLYHSFTRHHRRFPDNLSQSWAQSL